MVLPVLEEQNYLRNLQTMSTTPAVSTKFWGIWLPVPTVLAIFVAVFFTWLILSTVGFIEAPIEKAGESIIEQF